MSYSIYVSNLSPEQVVFSYSAALETMMALHVFHDCKHHPLHIPWVISARRNINSTLKQEIEVFSFLYKRPLVTFWALQGNSAFQSFEEGLKELASRSVEFFYHTIVETILNRKGTVIDPQLGLEFMEFACHRYPESAEVILDLVKNPERVKQRFLSMLEEFWRICVKSDWTRIEELFLKDIAYRGRVLMKDGVLQLLGSLSQEIDLFPNERRAVLRRISREDLFFEKDDELLLTPSYFAWPHIFVNLHPTVGINYSIMENEQDGARPMPPEDLLKFFSTLGDLSRLQIVKYLAQKPRSTSELAGLMGMTEGAVSKHIKLLKNAGLVASKRESYYVFHHLLEQPIHQLPQGLTAYLKG